jgi:hypothetical protein
VNPTTNLDPEEIEILEAFESDRLTRTANWQEELEQHKQIVSATLPLHKLLYTL